jgi:glucokinase
METGKQIGIVLANLANVFNPELIVLGGGLIEGLPLIVEEVARTVKERSLVTVQQNLKIKKSTLGNDGPVIGSALLVINKFLEQT